MFRRSVFLILIAVLAIVLPAAVAADGNISVSSSPSGATIYLNGTSTGLTTPDVIESVPDGSQNVTLVLSGYASYVWSEATVTDNETTTLSAGSLTNLTSSTSFTSYPPAAQVYLDNVYIGYTNISGYSVGYGSRTVLMQLAGYPDVTKTILVNGTLDTVTTDFSSSVENGTIYFSSYPEGAGVYILSNYTGITPLTVYNITPGAYTILMYKSGYLNWSDLVDVTSGSEKDVDATLHLAATTTTTEETAVLTPVPTAIPVETFAASAKTTKVKSAITVPTPWPTDTATQASPLDPVVLCGSVGLALFVMRRPEK
ncbi:PEGA domain-containing protein [Methanoregula sp.]|jgi:hypothetical protein|uniref:PEGA domain-containing protein n=1 Tax=Methanoregula sp. TaxID=2052170 RepID=UPI003C1A73B9